MRAARRSTRKIGNEVLRITSEPIGAEDGIVDLIETRHGERGRDVDPAAGDTRPVRRDDVDAGGRIGKGEAQSSLEGFGRLVRSTMPA